MPEWMDLPGERAPICKGCKQVAPENPAFSNGLLGEAWGPFLEEWRRMGMGIYLPALEADPERTDSTKKLRRQRVG